MGKYKIELPLFLDVMIVHMENHKDLTEWYIPNNEIIQKCGWVKKKKSKSTTFPYRKNNKLQDMEENISKSHKKKAIKILRKKQDKQNL